MPERVDDVHPGRAPLRYRPIDGEAENRYRAVEPGLGGTRPVRLAEAAQAVTNGMHRGIGDDDGAVILHESVPRRGEVEQHPGEKHGAERNTIRVHAPPAATPALSATGARRRASADRPALTLGARRRSRNPSPRRGYA